MPLDAALVAQLPADMNVDVDGKPVHIAQTPFIKEAKDFPSFVKGAYDAHREVGSRIPVKVDATKPEEIENWRKTHIPTLQKAGLLHTPPATPADYQIARPSEIPEGLGWDEARNVKFSTILHKYGVPKEMAAELVDLQKEAMTGGFQAIKTSVEEGMNALKKEHGDQFDTRMEAAKRLTSVIFKTPEELEWFNTVGLGDHPGFLSIIMRLAPLAMQDSSFMRDAGGGGGDAAMAQDEVRKEVADIMSNPNNPKHKLYWQRDKATMEYIDNLYKKIPGADQKVTF